LYPPSPSRVKEFKKKNQGTPLPLEQWINIIKQFPWPFNLVKSHLWKLQALTKSNTQWTLNSKKVIYKS
jgi:hypothetical protein